MLGDEAVQAYLERTVRAWVGAPADGAWVVPALPETLARLLLRVEEYERAHRDQWGCWEFGLSENFLRGSLWTAEVDRWVSERRAEAAEQVELVPLWPGGQPFAVCLTHDVDFVSGQATPAQVTRSLRAAFAGEGRSPALRAVGAGARLARGFAHGIRRAPATTEALERCVEIEREFGVSASYFFTVFPEDGFDRVDCLYLPDDRCTFEGRATTVAGVMRSLAAEGFDVGLHGSYNSAVVPGMLARERQMLERALGSEVRTTRQHFLHWDVRATPGLQDEAGLTADSTLGFNRNVGFRAGTSLPFHQFDLVEGRELGLLEVPLVVHDGPLLRPDGLELDTETAIEVVHGLMREVESGNGAATFLFHPNSLARDDFRAVYRAALELARERGAWITSLRGLADWWLEREARLSVS